jgi:hypothetical protein
MELPATRRAVFFIRKRPLKGLTLNQKLAGQNDWPFAPREEHDADELR